MKWNKLKLLKNFKIRPHMECKVTGFTNGYKITTPSHQGARENVCRDIWTKELGTCQYVIQLPDWSSSSSWLSSSCQALRRSGKVPDIVVKCWIRISAKALVILRVFVVFFSHSSTSIAPRPHFTICFALHHSTVVLTFEVWYRDNPQKNDDAIVG